MEALQFSSIINVIPSGWAGGCHCMVCVGHGRHTGVVLSFSTEAKSLLETSVPTDMVVDELVSAEIIARNRVSGRRGSRW